MKTKIELSAPTTDVGFKRVINKKHPLSKGMNRAFVKCRKCKERAFYDYIPFSLSNPIMTTNCGHEFKSNYTPF